MKIGKTCCLKYIVSVEQVKTTGDGLMGVTSPADPRSGIGCLHANKIMTEVKTTVVIADLMLGIS